MDMKAFGTLWAVGVVIALAVGCATTNPRTSEKERIGEKTSMLSAAGFQTVAANTPLREEHLKSLPRDRITAVQRLGTMFYTFPDPSNKLLYVGKEEQYQRYQNLRRQKQMAEEQLDTTQMYNEGAWGIWSLGWGPGWAWQ
jgi:hypothetical protein